VKHREILVLVIGCFLLLPFAVAEDDRLSWLKKEIKVNAPEKLMFSVSAYDDCPFTENEISEIVHGVLVRSRLKPEKIEGMGSHLYLNIALRCTKPSNGLYVYSSDIYFARWDSAPLLIQPNFGTVGDAKKQTIKNLLKESVEGAITVYVASNFLL
jgi:hypothetical protein